MSGAIAAAYEVRGCAHCGASFRFLLAAAHGRPGRGQFCSAVCKKEASRLGRERQCVTCGVAFKKSPSRAKEAHCSRACAGLALNRVTLACRECGRAYEVRAHKAESSHYCSRDCLAIAQSRSSRRRPLDSRTRLLWMEWRHARRTALERDSRTCRDCGERKARMAVHHVIDWIVSHDDSLDNLVTLCASCHARLHGRTRKAVA